MSTTSLGRAALENALGVPSFNLQYYVLGLNGDIAGVELLGNGDRKFAVANADGGARLMSLVPLHK